MKKAALVLVFLGLSGCATPEPLYQGQTLDFWVAVLGDIEPSVRALALEQVVAAASAHKDKRVATKLVAALQGGSYAAAEAMGKIGPLADQPNDTKAMVNALAAAIKTDNVSVRRSAARALPGFGADAKPAVPALLVMLKDGDESNRTLAAEVLGNLGGTASEALPALEAAKADASVGVQRAAAQALRQIDPDKWGKAAP